jgi:transcriptional regulator with XRE-family HTH domain
MIKIVRDSHLQKEFAARLEELKRKWSFALERTLLEITEEIAQQLLKQNITRADLAKKLGVSRSYVTQLVKGKPNLQLNTLFKVAYALGLRPLIRFESLEIEELNQFQQTTHGLITSSITEPSRIHVRAIRPIIEYETATET